MMKRPVRVGMVIAVALLAGSLLSTGHRSPKGEGDFGLMSAAGAEEPKSSPSTAMDAVKHAAEKGRYLFVFFHKGTDEQTAKMKDVFDAAMKKVAGKAESIAVNVADPSEKATVDRFGVSGAPMPLVLAVAPNGIITGGFPKEFDEHQLLDAIAGPCLQKCLKALKEGKLLFICVRNKTATPNEEAMKAVKDFKADPQYAERTELAELDPTDAAEEMLIQQLDIDRKGNQPVIVFLAPPGMMVGKFTGATTKDALVEALSNTMARCGTGCGSRSGFS